MAIWLKFCLCAILFIIRTNAIEVEIPKIPTDEALRTAEIECRNFPKLPSGDADTPPARDDFAHLVSLGYYEDNDKHITFRFSGSLVSKVYVLASIKSMGWVPKKKARVVRTGMRKFVGKDTFNSGHDYRVESYKRYDVDDIGLVLIRLETPVNFSRNVYPICLYTQLNVPSNNLIVADWKNTTDASKGVPMISLINREVKIISHEDSLKMFMDSGVTRIGPSKTIHISTTIISDCENIMYGPLHVKQDKEYKLVGVPFLSCFHFPDVYVRVSSALVWIENVVWPDAPTNIITTTARTLTTTPKGPTYY